MKVSRRVESYIQNQVDEKVKEKYRIALEEEAALNERIVGIRKQLQKILMEKTKELMLQDELIKEDQEIIGSLNDINYSLSCLVPLKSEVMSNVRAEGRKKLQEILASLELGGSKEDLDKLLSEI